MSCMLVRAKEVAFTKLLTPNLKKRSLSLALRSIRYLSSRKYACLVI